MELIPNSTLTTKQLRSHFKLSRRDAIAVKDRSVNSEGVAEGVAAYKGGKAYEERAKRRDAQGNGLNAKPRLCGWFRQGNGPSSSPAGNEHQEPLHINLNEPAVAGPVTLKSSKTPTKDALASKSKFPKRK